MPTVKDLDTNEELKLDKTKWSDWVMAELKDASVPKQLTVGAVSGWCAGYVSVRVGKFAAMAVGGTVLLLQIAHHQGYVSINWNKIKSEVQRKRESLEKKANKKLPDIIEQVQDFMKENIYVAGGFVGGFLLGVAC